MAIPEPEAWLRGPILGVPAPLMPVAHALQQAREDLNRHAAGITIDELWQRPGHAAPAGYHIKHLAGSLDRLFTYARGEKLNEAQRQALVEEGNAGATVEELLTVANQAIDRAIGQLRGTAPETLAEPRTVGRAALPTTVLGLLFHGGEHTTRHVGQLITTLKVLR